MIEKGNRKHIQAVRDVRQGEVSYRQSMLKAKAKQWVQTVMRQFCESLPGDRILQGNDADLDTAMLKERNFRTFVDPVSGAKLTYASSLVVLGHFVSCLVSIHS